MCIRDSDNTDREVQATITEISPSADPMTHTISVKARLNDCLLYTSDAADERYSVDIGGSRIIKKKKRKAVDTKINYERIEVMNTQSITY